ncbi:alpha/beta hydrolase [Leucobacter zeae]|nr:alpha/beta hydrolase [Leucobacter zeae]
MNAAHPPAPPRESRFLDGDTAIHCFRWERPGAPRLLLVHGIGLGHSVYDRFIGEIAADADVLAVDLPGFGSCPEPAIALSIPEIADLLAAAITEAGVAPLTAVGHSMGAQVVAELAARHPELVDRVVLIAASVNPSERSLWLQGLRMIQDISEGEPRSVLTRSTRTYLQAGPRWFAKQLRLMLAHRLEDALPRIEQPALVLRGARDRVSPRGWAVRMCGLLPRAEMQQIPDRGHEALISSGEPVARIVLDWIRDA